MRIWLVLFFALILTATAGCGRKETPETQMPLSGPGIAMPIQPSAVDFDKVQEVTPTGDFPKAVHQDLQPALASVFGGAKLSGFFTMGGQMNEGGSHLVYSLKRRSKADDVESVKKALAAKGYEFKGDISREQLKTLRFEKNSGGKVYSLTIGLTINDQRVGVAAFQ